MQELEKELRDLAAEQGNWMRIMTAGLWAAGGGGGWRGRSGGTDSDRSSGGPGSSTAAAASPVRLNRWQARGWDGQSLSSRDGAAGR